MATNLSPLQHAAIADALAQGIRLSLNLDCDPSNVYGVDLTALPSWPEYAKMRKLRSEPRWRHWLRRVFLPRRHKRLGRQFIEAQVWIQQELIDRVIEEGGKNG